MKYRYVCIRSEHFEKFLKEYVLIENIEGGNKETKKYQSEDNILIVDYYLSNLVIIKATKEINCKGLVDVRENKLYDDNNLNNIIVTSCYIEGTDGVGKTKTIEALINEGIVCFDRNSEICKYMLFDVDMDTRCQKYKFYLENSNINIIFLINNFKEELERRIYLRKNLSVFDKMAYKYNKLYLDTYNYLNKDGQFDKIKLIDVTGLTMNEQVCKVKKCIMEVVNE